MLIIASTLVFSIPVAGQLYKKKKSKRSVTIINSDNGRTTIKYSNETNRFELKYEGDIALSDDSNIVAISIYKNLLSAIGRIVIESDGSGRLQRAYYVGRKQQAFTPEGKKWPSEGLIDIVQTTTKSAEARVNRFYKNGGG